MSAQYGDTLCKCGRIAVAFHDGAAYCLDHYRDDRRVPERRFVKRECPTCRSEHWCVVKNCPPLPPDKPLPQMEAQPILG